MKIFKAIGKIILILLVLLIVLPLITVAIPLHGNANGVEAVGDTSIVSKTIEDDGPYPFIFVHGMMGWGENARMNETMPYWGMSHATDLMKHLRAEGNEVYAPSVSPVGSAYDRACELYAQLTGTRVDYGKAHADKYGHDRYGRDYTGKALMGKEWDLETKINLVGHSFGGPTIRVLASLLAYGSTEEVEATPDDCSELFKGSHAGCINAVVTLASPSNGTPAANLLDDTYACFIFAAVMNKFYDEDNPYDPMMDQWGMREQINLKNDLRVGLSKDTCGYDMTINGAGVLNKKFPTVPEIYYISYSADLEGGDADSYKAPSGKNILKPTYVVNKFMTHLVVDGHILGSEWIPNDGLVPVVSAEYPTGDKHADYKEGMKIERGIWAVTPTTEGQTHGYYCSPAGDVDTFYQNAEDMIRLVNSLK